MRTSVLWAVSVQCSERSAKQPTADCLMLLWTCQLEQSKAKPSAASLIAALCLCYADQLFELRCLIRFQAVIASSSSSSSSGLMSAANRPRRGRRQRLLGRLARAFG